MFKHDHIVRKALIDICCLLDTKSWELGITLTSSGLVAGNLMMYMYNGKIVDCSKTTEGTFKFCTLHKVNYFIHFHIIILKFLFTVFIFFKTSNVIIRVYN